MPFLVIDLLLGIVCTYLGYQIYFKGRFDFINNYIEEKRQGVVGENYARKVGKIFFVMGNLFFLVGIIFIVIKVVQFLITAVFVLVGIMIISLIYNRVKNKFK